MDMRTSEPGPAKPGLIAIGLILLILPTISACGFKLRGPIELPPEIGSLFVQAPPESRVRDPIIQQLRSSQIQVADEPDHTCAIIRISDERHSSRVIAVDRNNKALARELHYRLTFDLVTTGGVQLVPPQTLELTRSYEDSDRGVLGKQLEAELLHEEMLTDAAKQILSRLRAAL